MKLNKSQTNKILLIDDDKFLLRMYKIKFENSGLEVVALNKLKTDFITQIVNINPDLIVSDFVRPKPDGLDVLKGLRKDKRTEDIPFIFLSNTLYDDGNKTISQSEYVKKAKKLGVSSFILKATTTPLEVSNVIIDVLTKLKNENK